MNLTLLDGSRLALAENDSALLPIEKHFSRSVGLPLSSFKTTHARTFCDEPKQKLTTSEMIETFKYGRND